MVYSLFFLAWYLVISNPNSKDTDVDKLRIEHSSSKKLFQIATNDTNYFEDYLIHPGYKMLEYFVPPVIKKGNHFDIKHLELDEEVRQLYKKMKPKIDFINDSFSKNQNLKDEGEGEGEEQKEVFEFKHSDEFNEMDLPREYRCFITELYKKRIMEIDILNI